MFKWSVQYVTISVETLKNGFAVRRVSDNTYALVEAPTAADALTMMRAEFEAKLELAAIDLVRGLLEGEVHEGPRIKVQKYLITGIALARRNRRRRDYGSDETPADC